MDEDKIIIIPEKYYMQIYQVGFWFLIIMSIICIAYGFFANEKSMVNVYYNRDCCRRSNIDSRMV